MKKIAVVLSGCGFKDGAEITEAVSTLIALGECGYAPSLFAPSVRFTPMDHLTGNVEKTERDTLVEAARIARGKIQDLAKLRAQGFDAVVFPGGFGAALYLCDWARRGASCEPHPEAKRVVEEFYNAKKPIGAICIAPALLAKVLGPKGVTLTIGQDRETAQEIEKTGAKHQDCSVTSCVVDKGHKIVTSPAYMYDDAPPHQVFKGIQSLAAALKNLF